MIYQIKNKYRPEIDGLRTIAVVSVIIYHSNFILFGQTLFKGGFIGVDIFFVISGYLITNLILKEIYQTNNFKFKYFYQRRIRRIIPLLLFITIIVSIISYFILLPFSLINFGKSVVSITFFVSNFYFYIANHRYGQEDSLEQPLLHTWSLSVEEQFYILFPVFLIITINRFRKNLFKILFLTFLISLIFSVYFSKTHFFSNFYLLYSRIFELLVGSLLSYYELNNKEGDQESFSILNQVFPIFGIILIFYAIFFFDLKKIFHPSVITLVPLIGVILIIFYSKKGGLIFEILSSKIFVFFGIISYSLYLWHYPIFAFLRYIDVFNNHVWIKLSALFLTISLSVLSYYFIEKPFRNSNIISDKILTFYIILSAIILLSFSLYILKTDGIKKRFPNIISKKLISDPLLLKEQDYPAILRYNKSKNIFLIGDSHALSLQFILNEELKKNYYNFFPFVTPDDYLYVQNFQQINSRNVPDDKYIKRNKYIEEFLSQEKGLVILHQRWMHQIYERVNYVPLNTSLSSKEKEEEYLIEGITQAIQTILNQGHDLILVYPVPEMNFNPSRAIIKHYQNILEKFKNKNKYIEVPILKINYEDYKKRNKKIFEILDTIQGPNVYRVYPDKSFCNSIIIGACVANNNEDLFYYDDNHLSLEGSKYIVSDIIKLIKLIEIDREIKSSDIKRF